MTMEGQSVESTLINVRDEMMVSSTAHLLTPSQKSLPFKRPAHFLNSSQNSIDGSVSYIPPKPITEKSHIGFNFCRMKTPVKEWIEWVDIMRSKYQAEWKEAGVFDAIMNSKYTIYRDDALLHDFAARWCSETNTFLFPWGEATLTLEDMLMLGGYSILGNLVNSPPEPQENVIEEIKILERERSQLSKSKSKKACHGAWLIKFMNSQNENEHEAFLVYWLSRFVFPLAEGTIVKSVIPIAVHLAKGTKIALAPGVLASIYSDLNEYKNSVFISTNRVKKFFVSSPFHLIQIWVWERFNLLQPKPKTVEPEEPPFAKWHELKRNNGRIKDKAVESFTWKPYNKSGGIDKEEVEAKIKCLRVSQIAGIETTKIIQQYLPHRVAMQFGLDQDIPAVIEQSKLVLQNYDRPIEDKGFCIPCRIFEPNVTVRYLEWWMKPKSTHDGDFEDLSNKKPKLMDSGTHSQCNAQKEKFSRGKNDLDSCKNSSITGSENKSKPFRRAFGNVIEYKNFIRQMVSKSREQNPCSSSAPKEKDCQPDEAVVTYLPSSSSKGDSQSDEAVVTYLPSNCILKYSGKEYVFNCNKPFIYIMNNN